MNHVLTLTTLRITGVAVLAVSAWSVWERRLTFRSRFDVAATVSTALFGIGALLDSPWPAFADVTLPLTHKHYVVMVVGHLCYLAGGAAAVRAIYRRLLPDDAIGPFMTRVEAVVLIAGLVMLVAFAASRVSSVRTVDHLYLTAPDGWLKLYWLFHFGTTTLLGVIAGYGVFRLREDPRSVMLNLTLAALLSAAVAGGLVVGWGVITDRIETLRLVAWLITYLAFMAAATATAAQWRHRVRALVQSPLR